MTAHYQVLLLAHCPMVTPTTNYYTIATIGWEGQRKEDKGGRKETRKKEGKEGKASRLLA